MRRLTLSVLLATAALPAFADAPRVVTDIAPVHSLVSQVMAGVGTPDLLLDGSADPHSVQLKPSQARAVSQADLVVWVGEELEPWLARVLAGRRVRMTMTTRNMRMRATIMRTLITPSMRGTTTRDTIMRNTSMKDTIMPGMTTGMTIPGSIPMLGSRRPMRRPG